MNHEEATAECFVIAKQLGERFARTIMQTTVLHNLEPDQMEALVHFCIDDFRAALMEGGAGANDAEAAAQHVYAALVKEGARLARTVTWEGGSA